MKRAQAFFESLSEMLDDYLKEEGDSDRPEKGSKKNAPKKNPKTAVAKDVNAPKKPLTAFMLYCGHRRTQMKAQDPSKRISRP